MPIASLTAAVLLAEAVRGARLPSLPIAVNDASTDDTAAVLDRIVRNEPRLRVIHLRSNQGKAMGLRVAALAARHEGRSVAVYEKADRVGGTSAWSGGMIWIPDTHHMRAAGIPDSKDEAVGYLLSMSHGIMDEALVRAFVDTGPEMVRWLEAKTPVQFQSVGAFPDYHPEHPGGKPKLRPESGKGVRPRLRLHTNAQEDRRKIRIDAPTLV